MSRPSLISQIESRRKVSFVFIFNEAHEKIQRFQHYRVRAQTHNMGNITNKLYTMPGELANRTSCFWWLHI